jgi:hypothetical protein
MSNLTNGGPRDLVRAGIPRNEGWPASRRIPPLTIAVRVMLRRLTLRVANPVQELTVVIRIYVAQCPLPACLL